MHVQLSTGQSNLAVKEAWVDYTHDLQNRICMALENVDGKAKFLEDEWQRDGGGGGKTRVIANGNVFEKGGVNTSVVFGRVTDPMRTQLRINGDQWWACGLSLVLHPVNPFVPTVHCNYRMFEVQNSGDVTQVWFGGGTDLTPYYLFAEDAVHFHKTYRDICDEFDPSFYPVFKKDCDDYFVNKHRNNERRGVGGIFYDQQQPDEIHSLDFWLNFGRACGSGFLSAYLPIVEKRKNIPFSDKHKHWQEIRRGRYVEFNLVHDRGTLFGLKTNGRIESILMSLPPTVRFEYDYQPVKGSEEEKLIEVLMNPKDWI